MVRPGQGLNPQSSIYRYSTQYATELLHSVSWLQCTKIFVDFISTKLLYTTKTAINRLSFISCIFFCSIWCSQPNYLQKLTLVPYMCQKEGFCTLITKVVASCSMFWTFEACFFSLAWVPLRKVRGANTVKSFVWLGCKS